MTDAVTGLQAREGLRVDGLLNPGGETEQTINNKLSGKPRGAGLLHTPATALTAPVGNGQANKPGDVISVKRQMGALGLVKEDPFDTPAPFIDPGTDQAIRAFQGQQGLKTDGLIAPGGPTETALSKTVKDFFAKNRMTFEAWHKAQKEQQEARQDAIRLAGGVELPSAKWGSRSENTFNTASDPDKPALENDLLRAAGLTFAEVRPRAAGAGVRRLNDGSIVPEDRQRLILAQHSREERPEENQTPGTVIGDGPVGSDISIDRGKEISDLTEGPALNEEQERIRSIINGRPANFSVAENPDATGEEPAHAVHIFGVIAVARFNDIIEDEARAFGVDPNLVRAIMYVENAQGGLYGYPAEHSEEISRFLYGRPIPWFRAKSLYPMNIRHDVWGTLGFSEEDFRNPRANIRAAVLVLREIIARTNNPTIASVATLYNFTGAETVNDYGMRVLQVYRLRPWSRPPRLLDVDRLPRP